MLMRMKRKRCQKLRTLRGRLEPGVGYPKRRVQLIRLSWDVWLGKILWRIQKSKCFLNYIFAYTSITTSSRNFICWCLSGQKRLETRLSVMWSRRPFKLHGEFSSCVVSPSNALITRLPGDARITSGFVSGTQSVSLVIGHSRIRSCEIYGLTRTKCTWSLSYKKNMVTDSTASPLRRLFTWSLFCSKSPQSCTPQ